MNELKSNKAHRPPNKVKDAAGLNTLLGFLNDSRVTGAVVPKGAVVKADPTDLTGAVATTETPTVQREPTPEQPPVSAPATALVAINKVAFTGRLMSGKDWCAAAAGLKIFSLAEPLYALQRLFFGTADKTLPGAREFLQTIGQWGRGEVSKQYPLTPERAMFTRFIRDGLPSDLDMFRVRWKFFGAEPDLWLNAMLARVDDYLEKNPGARVAVTNARFSNELTRLTAEGFAHFHTMASAATWSARLQKVGLMPESPATKDISEQLAASLDANVIKTLSKAKHGPKLRCCWSDDKMPPPSQRLLTVTEFCALFPKT